MKGLVVVLFVSLASLLNAQSNTFHMEGFAQGTMYHITYVDSLQRYFRDSINEQLRILDASLSTYRENSIISKINRNEEVQTDLHFQLCFNRSKEIWRESGGVLDATVLPLTQLYGLRKPDLGPFTREKLDSILTFVGYGKVRIENGFVVKDDPRIQLDFNAFAQGYSVDVLGDYLKTKGIDNFLIEIGGEVLASGVDEQGASWLVGIEKPIVSNEQILPLFQAIALNDKAIATSGNYRKFLLEGAEKYGHQINPLTGECAISEVLSASVIAKDALTADAYATVFCVLGLKASKELIRQHPELELSMIYATDDGHLKSWQTPGFTQHLQVITQDLEED